MALPTSSGAFTNIADIESFTAQLALIADCAMNCSASSIVPRCASSFAA